MQFFKDNWINKGNGHEVNQPIAFQGEVIKHNYIFTENHLFEYMQMVNGDIYRRSSNYYEHSPYGWDKVESFPIEE